MEGYTESGVAMTCLILKMFPLNSILHALGDEITRETGLTSSRWQVLGAIQKKSGTVASIARELGLSRQAVLRSTGILCKQRLVELASNPEHKKASLVIMTEKGNSVFVEMLEVQRKWVNQFAAGISGKEIMDAVKVLDILEQRAKSQLELKA